MSDQVLITLILVSAALAFGFGIWAGLGYPGLYDKYEKTGRAPRHSPLNWIVRGGRRPRTSERCEAEDGERKTDSSAPSTRSDTRPRFERGRRFRR